MEGNPMRTQTMRQTLSATTLKDQDVVNGANEDIGTIEDFMIDLESGRVNYAVLSFGGFLGMGDKLFAVPYEALRIDPENERFVLDVPKERLEKAPGFEKSDWPEFGDDKWTREVHSHWGTTPRS
jgi:sporulation protein YlmC with PRC-barrel domain